jgi:hypothetical protein
VKSVTFFPFPIKLNCQPTPIFDRYLNTKIMEDWNTRKAKVKEQLTKLSEINSIEDKREQLISRLELRLGASRESIIRLLSELRIR